MVSTLYINQKHKKLNYPLLDYCFKFSYYTFFYYSFYYNF